MNLELLVTTLNPLFSNRVFPDMAPFNTPKPYCTFQPIGGKPMNLWAGGATDITFSRIQFNVWASSRLEADALIKQLENTVKSDPLFGRSEGGPIARTESENLRGYQQDFTFAVSMP